MTFKLLKSLGSVYLRLRLASLCHPFSRQADLFSGSPITPNVILPLGLSLFLTLALSPKLMTFIGKLSFILPDEPRTVLCVWLFWASFVFQMFLHFLKLMNLSILHNNYSFSSLFTHSSFSLPFPPLYPTFHFSSLSIQRGKASHGSWQNMVCIAEADPRSSPSIKAVQGIPS